MRNTDFTIQFIMATAGIVLVGAMLRLPPVMSVNDASRWNTVWALTHGRGYVIDPPAEDPVWEALARGKARKPDKNTYPLHPPAPGDGAPYHTIDRWFRRADGHFYSSKPALLPTVLSGVAMALGAVTGWELPGDDGALIRTLLVFLNILPFMGLLYVFDRVLRRLEYSDETRLACVVFAAFGTYLTAYSVTLNNHTVAAVAVFFALAAAIQIKIVGRQEWRWFALCGGCSAWAAVNDLPSVLFAGGLLVWLLVGHWRPTLIWGLPMALVILGAFLWATYASTGSVIPTNFATERFSYPGSGLWAGGLKGIDAIQGESKGMYAFHFLCGHHGFFSLTPILLLGLYGMIWDRGPLRWVHRAGGVLSLVLLLAYALRTPNYGGVCQGPRWLFWVIPFWLLASGATVERFRHSRIFWTLAGVLFFVSLVSVGYALTGAFELGVRGPWGESWLHRLMRGAGWIDY